MQQTGLTKRETQIMNILWNSDEPLSAHDILTASPELSRNTIQIVLKKLQTLGFIEVAGFGYHKNALTRTFKPVISQSDYIASSLADSTSYEIAISFIQRTDNEEVLENLEKLIQEKQKELKNAR
ncbi:BlaI/MecI/CopY family transcriptional regulator [Allobaculum mucilyticum]|uniref:BlaI/MecI/CopY family transcriptional regulator n=1 Tax=Allobaculum mucilyticum TaxID=2834459 RepID=UPI001E2E86FE|nr:BlaI/MecI/CopY family transcriptional regulator [Allobaculum mucilyticum]UNT95082.1 BlaI/MecI/CopY family transcriptional regulator [Allobaculum mucilyticum]